MKKRYQLATWTVGVSLFAALSPEFALADGNTAVPVVQTAETGLSQQQALDLVKKLFLIDDSYKLTHVGRNESGKSQNYYGPYVGTLPGALDTWNFNFTKGDGANAANMNVSVNAQTGTIRNFGLYYNQGVQSDSSDSISADSAKQIALTWIAKLAPDQAKLLDEGKDMYQNGFKPNNNSTSFRFNRMVNGIPFQFDGVNITISNHGDLLNYNLTWTWDDSKFPSATAAITQDQAAKTFASLPLSLHYVQQWMPYADGPTVQLIYSSLNSYGFNGPLPVVDAVYGTLVDGAGKPVSASVYTLNPIATAPGAPLTTSPLSDKDAAAAFAKKLLNLDDSYTLSNSNYNAPGDAGTGPKTWNLSFAKSSSTSTPDKPSMINISVTINADTGELMNYWNNNAPDSSTNSGASTLTWDQAVQKAKDFLMKVAPTQVNNLALQAANPINGGKFPNAYMVNFTHLVNGIPFDYSNVNVSVNQYTGEILNYNGYFNYQNLTYPDPAKAVSLQNAQAAFASHYKMQLQYVIQPGTPANGTQPATDPMPKLVYAPINSDNTFNNEVLDAISGQFMSINGQPVHHDVLDIKDHWAAKQLQDFADRGLIELKDGKVTPDQQLTRAKALHLLLLAVRPPYYYRAGASSSSASSANDIAAAKAAGWIDQDMTDFRPNDFLTREELADFAAHVMGYGKLASKPNIFKNLYTDISNDDKYLGDIAIASALGVMKGESQDTFSPSEKVTLAQVVVVADRIVKLQGNGPIYHPY